MEIIDKSHKHAKIIITKPYISFAHDMQRFFVNSPAATIFGLYPGMYVHFMNDVDRLYAYFDYGIDGVKGYDNQGGLVFRSAPVLHLLNRSNPLVAPSSKFPVRKSNTKINEAITLEIMIHNKIRNKIK